jgi:chromosome segregation ATPase
MEFDELLITTGVDALVRLVKERQRIELEDAAGTLNIPLETIEDWARVLEEEGILSIEYRLTRIYLVWIQPTREEIATEAESFYEEKRGIVGEVEAFRKKITKETEGVGELQKAFDDFYSKTQSKIEKLEKLVAPLPTAKAVSEEAFSKYEDELTQMGKDLKDVKGAIKGIEKEVKGLGVGKEAPAKALIDKIEKATAELHSLQGEMEELRKKAAHEKMPADVAMPSTRDIKKKFDSLKKDFSSLRSRNAKLREDMISLQESSEILKNVAESVMEREEKIGGLGKEMATLSEEADRLLAKSKDVSEKVKEHAELVERLGESVTVAKGIIKRFPSQQKVLKELEDIKESEKALVEKNASLEKIIEAVGGRQVTAKRFAELLKRMNTKATKVRKDIDSLEAALEDEKGTYLTFQKIKERIVPSIESYYKQLDKMEERIESIRKEAMEQQKGLKEDAKKLGEGLKAGEMKEIMKVAGEIRDKKKMLDEIKGSLDDLVAMSNNLSKRITLLAREARLLEIRAGTEAGAPPEEEKRKEIRHKLKLSEEEEMEFRKKREELKKLIRKLWEE